MSPCHPDQLRGTVVASPCDPKVANMENKRNPAYIFACLLSALGRGSTTRTPVHMS